jgi:hypothetical protein
MCTSDAHGVFIQLAMPPPSSSNGRNPLIRPASSRKRKETRRIIENADPQLPKNKKLKVSFKGRPHQDIDTETHLSQSTRKSSLDFEEDGDGANEDGDAPPSLDALGQVLDELAYGEEGSDGEEELSIIDVDEMVAPPDENAESELSRPITAL